MKLKSLYDLYIHELQDLHSAESQIRLAVPELIHAARGSDLKHALKSHLEETRDHLDRLNQILKKHGERRERDKCRGIEGLLTECENMVDREVGDILFDLGIVSACQRIEHYEIAGYGTARAYAESLGEDEDAALLATTLEEERSANDELTSIATMLQSQCKDEARVEESRYSMFSLARTLAGAGRR